jgi:CRP/FNR family transcriptional regulator
MRHAHDGKGDRLRATTLFAHLDRKELEAVEEATTELQLTAGTVLAREGHSGHEAFVILDGTVDISIDGNKVGTAGPNEIVGEMALLLREPRRATVTAATDVDILVIEPGRWDDLLVRVPTIPRQLLVSLARRLASADDKLH